MSNREPLTICDGNCRLLAEVDPGTHRMHLTMEILRATTPFGDEGEWEPVGAVSQSSEQAAEFADAVDSLVFGGGHE